jgi:uncharacterized protein (TIGR03086 family)
MTTESLERAFASTRKVLAGVDADRLDQSTPCQSWDVRQVINHIVGGSHWFAASTEAGESPALEDTDYAGGDFVAAFDEGAAKSVAAFAAPGAQERMIKLPFGTMPGSAFMGLATTDTFTHGWDLARATGQDTDLDPELAAQLLEGARAAIGDQFRGADGTAPFGPIVEVPDDAPAADQLAGFLGRKV